MCQWWGGEYTVPIMNQKVIRIFTNVSFSIILVLAALLPVFFLPSTWSGLGAVKGVLLYAAVFLAASCWLVAQFVQGSLSFARSRVLLMLGALVVLVLISSLASANVTVSLWGRGFALDSFATILVLALLAFLIATFTRDQRRLVKLFLAAFSGSVLTLFLQIVLHLTHSVGFVSKYLSHVAVQGTLVGSWVDFAYVVTFTFVLALLMYEVLSPKGFFRIVSLVAMILSVIALIFLNFTPAWIVAILSALLVFVYKSSVERSITKLFPKMSADDATESNPEPLFPVMSFAALLIGLFFFLSSASIGASLANRAGISFTDIRPSFTTTTHVMRASLWHDPVWGAGAGRYADAWNLYRPAASNQTMFWNTPFESGFSLLQSFLTTWGVVPFLALLAALIFCLIQGFKLFSYSFPDRFSRFIAVTTVIMLVGFVALFALSTPGLVLVTYCFMYIGLLLGVSTLVGRTKVVTLNYLQDPRSSFFAILILVVAAMIGFVAVYFSGNRFASIVMYNRALAATDIQTAQARLDHALSLSQNDLYWRTRSALFTTQFATLAKQEFPDKTALQAAFSQAENSASAAVSWDKGSANNWLTLSQVYQLVSSDSNAEAYGNAKVAADEAQTRNPNNPILFLNQAQLALTKSDTQSALAFIEQALVLKADYLDAYVLRAQIKSAQGDSGAAKNALISYTKVAPLDAQGFVLLGQVYVGAKEYQNAVEAFGQAQHLAPNDPNVAINYINALVLAGQKTQAIETLKAFKLKYPGVTGVDEQIKQLETPVAPVAPATPEKKN